MEGYIYKIDKNKKYQIYYTISQTKLNLFISDLSAIDNTFTSNYLLGDLNAKLTKLIQFKTIEEFQSLLYQNIKEKTLVLKPYKNVINSIWRIFPLSKDKLQTFSLISSMDINQNISLFFYSDYLTSEKVVKEMETAINIKIHPIMKEEKTYTKIVYNNWLIDSIFFIKNNNNDEEKQEEFTSLYK